MESYLVVNTPSMGLLRREVVGIQAQAFERWGEYMKVAIPALVQMCSEWWFWDIATFSLGYLTPVALAAHTDTMMINSLLTMPAVGLQFASASLVGNALGSEQI